MGSSFNDQWVLGRTPPRRGEPVTVTGQRPSEGHRTADPHRLPAHAHPGAGFGLALTPRRVRKHPRWIDRDT
jgi:hypothetical protein